MPHSTGDWGWDNGQHWHWEYSCPIMHWGWLREWPSPATTFQMCTTKMLRDEGSAVHQQPRRPERGVPPSPVTTEMKPKAWSRTTTTTSPSPTVCLFLCPPSVTSLMHSLLHFSVMLKLLCPTDNFIFSHMPTNRLLYCTVYSPLTHFQRWLGIIIPTHGPPLEP